MTFTDKQLENIAKWKPADERFTSVDPVQKYILPALSFFDESDCWKSSIIDNGSGGLSNYYSVAIYPMLTKKELSSARHYKPYHGDAVLVYLSLMYPVGAIGRTSISLSALMFAHDPLELDSLVRPVRGIDKTIDAILHAFQDSIYQFLDRESLSQPLPPHIKPDEYCLCDEPWDRVFHVLFANTD